VKQAFLVDDSKSARIVLSRLLKKNGFDQVKMAESGEEALEQLQTLTPDAIFVDFLMDGMDGLQTIMEIKKDPRFMATPVVMCTANEGDEYVQAAVDHGALGILAKPPTDQSLNEIIDLIDEHQQEMAANDAVQPVRVPVEAVEAAPVETAEVDIPTTAPPAAAGLDEAAVRRIASEVAAENIADIATQRAEQVAEELVNRLLAKRVEAAVVAYLDKQLETLVGRLVERWLAAFKAPEIDMEDLRSQVVQQVSGDLEESVRQLNQRTVEELIEARVYEPLTELARDFSRRLNDSETRILEQVPDKNEMVDHIRMVTEGSLESQVRETATYVAQEISNSVATETVETLLEEHLAHQSVTQQKSKSSGRWIATLLALIASGVGAYFYYLYLMI
jgi:CheY-like chemotaxis protein